MAKRTEHKMSQSIRDAKLSPGPAVLAVSIKTVTAAKPAKRPRPNRHRRGGASVGGMA